MITKNSESLVKYSKDGKESEEKVPYTTTVVESLEDAMNLANDAVAKVGETEGDTVVTADNRQDLMVAWILAKVNQVLEANARQNARAAFLTSVAGPDKQIQTMAKKMAALKKITVEEAEKQLRAAFGF